MSERYQPGVDEAFVGGRVAALKEFFHAATTMYPEDYQRAVLQARGINADAPNGARVNDRLVANFNRAREGLAELAHYQATDVADRVLYTVSDYLTGVGELTPPTQDNYRPYARPGETPKPIDAATLSAVRSILEARPTDMPQDDYKAAVGELMGVITAGLSPKASPDLVARLATLNQTFAEAKLNRGVLEVGPDLGAEARVKVNEAMALNGYAIRAVGAWLKDKFATNTPGIVIDYGGDRDYALKPEARQALIGDNQGHEGELAAVFSPANVDAFADGVQKTLTKENIQLGVATVALAATLILCANTGREVNFGVIGGDVSAAGAPAEMASVSTIGAGRGGRPDTTKSSIYSGLGREGGIPELMGIGEVGGDGFVTVEVQPGDTFDKIFMRLNPGVKFYDENGYLTNEALAVSIAFIAHQIDEHYASGGESGWSPDYFNDIAQAHPVGNPIGDYAERIASEMFRGNTGPAKGMLAFDWQNDRAAKETISTAVAGLVRNISPGTIAVPTLSEANDMINEFIR